VSKNQIEPNRGPIFVVGSPRSGTSILTWCLGQHPNILPQEESCWIGQFAINVGVQFETGSSRQQRSQLSALGVKRAEFFQTLGDSINAMVLNHRCQQEQLAHECSKLDPSQNNPALNISRSLDEPKSRWVDGTPEYSHHIAGLRKFFPDAKFIHIVRDARSVVNSLLNFKTDGEHKLVTNEQQAYEYWLGTVQACLQAERAYGPQVVHRVRYEDLVRRPEQTVSSVLDFLNEPYSQACLEPLANKINSSCVPENFNGHDPRTDATLVETALQLSDQLQQSHRPLPMSADALTQIEADFGKRVAFVAQLDDDYAEGQRKVAALTRRLNWCGAMLVAGFLMAITAHYMRAEISKPIRHMLWLATSGSGLGIYLMIRRAGLRGHAEKMLHKCGDAVLGVFRTKHGMVMAQSRAAPDETSSSRRTNDRMTQGAV
jgi:hypothetical protein